MPTKLRASERAEILSHILPVLETGVPWKDPNLHLPVQTIVEAVLSIKGVERVEAPYVRYGITGFDTNGWQWDWWQHFGYQGRRYVLCGHGYYGGHSFHSSDEP